MNLFKRRRDDVILRSIAKIFLNSHMPKHGEFSFFEFKRRFSSSRKQIQGDKEASRVWDPGGSNILKNKKPNSRLFFNMILWALLILWIAKF